jgi:hypothetical protein
MMLAGLAMAGLVGCGKGASDSAADSTRNVDLVMADSSYAPGDRPPGTAAVRPPASPAAAPSAERTLESGVRIDAITVRTISSRTDKAGATFTANVSSDLKDSRGRVVIPAGSIVNLTITELQPADDKTQADGRITVLVSSVNVGGRIYAVSGDITSMEHTLKGRGVGATEVQKTAAGVVVGGIAGRVIGGNTKGTVIGAVAGGAAGAAVAAITANRDVVVTAGTPLVITLSGPLTLASR